MTAPRKQWDAEREVDAELAARLIETQFPDLAPVELAPLGVGWDNTAYVVNDAIVFRFPRREIAVPLIETEVRLLPSIASSLPLPIPVPAWAGEATDDFPWPFAGYRMLHGRTACTADLDDAERAASASALGAFLRALHDVPVADATDAGAGPDTIRRLDLPFRAARAAERFEEAAALGLLPGLAPWQHIIDDLPSDWTAGSAHLVHGDFYARHVLVDDAGTACGVIDWGDVHLGDPAGDLSIAPGFLPANARDTFRDAYGDIADTTWRVARFRALHAAILIVVYGHDVGDEALLSEGRNALRFLEAQD